jgi:peptidoglycan hydrolase-like protein with peptidoglycan-binding domain
VQEQAARRLAEPGEEAVNRRLRIMLVAGAAGVAAAVVAGAAVGLGGGAAGTGRGTGPVLATVPVTRATLTQTQQVNGTLGYGAPVTVNGRGSGVITWLPAPGAVIGRGRPVYKADNRPVPLFYGRLPLYRPLQAGDTGADVREVERNLAALGYTGLTVDTYYTAATAAAVWAWQQDLGLTPTGVLDPTEVVLARGRLRVASLTAHLGDQASGPVLAYASTRRVVRVALDVALQSLARRGAAATVTLPDGSTVNATIARVGAVATAATGSNPATIEVTVTIAHQSALGRLDQAPVTVKLVSARVRNVLTVPVAALVGLSGGGYGVQVVTGTARRYVRVQLGMFAGGRVQVTGAGIAEGTRVGVPS